MPEDWAQLRKDWRVGRWLHLSGFHGNIMRTWRLTVTAAGRSKYYPRLGIEIGWHDPKGNPHARRDEDEQLATKIAHFAMTLLNDHSPSVSSTLGGLEPK